MPETPMKVCESCGGETPMLYRWRGFLDDDQWVCRDCLLDLQSLTPPRKDP